MGINKVQYGNTVLIDLTDTTAVASDVLAGKYFYGKDGVKTLGTGTGGGGGSVTQDQDGYIVLPSTGGGSPSATQHVIHLEFTDSTDTDINVYYDDSLISTMITAYTPETYGQKTVTLAQLDGVTWYEPTPIPLNTQLIDYSKCINDTAIDSDGEEIVQEWYWACDYTPVENGMTFSYKASLWNHIAFYDSSKTFISSIYVYNDGTVDPDNQNTGVGTLSGNKMPVNAKYVRMCGVGDSASYLSLIRTA